MPLFRRRQTTEIAFTVGVDGHVVTVGGDSAGCMMLDEIDGYVGAIASRVSTRPDGRDTIAMLNAKMDYAELVDAAVLVVTLAIEELVAQQVLSENDAPPVPPRAQVPPDLATYDYIQTLYDTARRRREWLRAVDTTLRQRQVAVLPPD